MSILREFGSALVACSLVVAPVAGQQRELDARTRDKIAAMEKLLPESEKAADECEKALAPLRDSPDANVRAAVDGALLRIAAVRSLRTIIAKEPAYLTWHLGEASLRQWQEGMDHFLACAKIGRDPFQGATSGVRTVRSPVDGQLLFYVFRLPRDYDPAKRYPVDVSLHSGAGLTWRAGWIDGKPSTEPAKAAKDQRIWISPCGRGNNCYAGMGEVAVMDAIRDLKRHYAVDEDRITIGGASMGGTGGFRLATLHPDVFAAGHSLTGGPHYSVPRNDGRFDAMLLMDNLCNTAFCIWDAPREGHYATNHAFAGGLRERGKSYPGYYSGLELTDPEGGHGIIDRKLQTEGWDWLRLQKRDPLPRLVIYKTYSLRYDGAYWARLDTIEDAQAPARIEAELGQGGAVRVAVDNADRFHLDLTKPLTGAATEVAVRINGAAALKAPAGRTLYFAKEGGKWALSSERYPRGLVKKHGVSGPIQDVFMGEPVLLVHGSRSGKTKEQAGQMLDDAVQRLLGPGDGSVTLHTAFERKADRDVNADDIAGKHLVLFGTPRQNLLLERIANKLPVLFLEDGVWVAGTSYKGEGIGLNMVYPNPLNPERYVLILPEEFCGGSPWTYPDYLVSKAVKGPNGPRLQVLAQGTFNARWSLPPP